MIQTIVLKGYYGFRNFGDDLLFIVSWKWLRASFPGAGIVVCTESKDPQYLETLVNESLKFIRNQDAVNADLIFHGGGGTYFDFRKGPFLFRILNTMADVLKPNRFRKVYNLVQGMRGRTRVKGTLRVGVGLGIGSYTLSSRRFPFDCVELAEFDLMGVRDLESLHRLRSMRLPSQLVLASDLAFLTSHWIPESRPLPRSKRLGIVLRDWPYDDHAHHNIIETAAQLLMEHGYSLIFFSFDQSDRIYKQRFASMGEWMEWNPGKVLVNEFVHALGECERIVSSRAHGVIVASCLGIPSLALEIEPKLKSVASLVPSGVSLVQAPFTPQSIVEAVTKTFQPGAADSVQSEVEENARKVQAALEQVAELVCRLK